MIKGIEIHFPQSEQFALAYDCVAIDLPVPESQQGLFFFIPVLI